MKKDLLVLKESDIRSIIGRPSIRVFSDNMSLTAILQKAYVEPNYHLNKCNADFTGLFPIYKTFNKKNIIFVGEGGSGKTSAFLRLYFDADESICNIADKPFYYFFAPNYYGNNVNNYNKKLRKIIKEGNNLDGILLLDGLEEAFLYDIDQAKNLIKRLHESEIVFWASCRPSFYEKLDSDRRQ